MHKISFILFFICLLTGNGISSAFAHTTIMVENYEIEVGWQEEPPVVGLLNAITFEIKEKESESIHKGITNAFKDLLATAKFGGVEKLLDINSDPRPGHYFSKIIPTRTGSIVVELKGEINGIPIDAEIPIEDVESQAVLAFPDISDSSSGQDISAIKNAMAGLQKEVSNIKSKLANVDTQSADFDIESAYNFGVLGLSLGAAGVILAIIAMVKRK